MTVHFKYHNRIVSRPTFRYLKLDILHLLRGSSFTPYTQENFSLNFTHNTSIQDFFFFLLFKWLFMQPIHPMHTKHPVIQQLRGVSAESSILQRLVLQTQHSKSGGSSSKLKNKYTSMKSEKNCFSFWNLNNREVNFNI